MLKDLLKDKIYEYLDIKGLKGYLGLNGEIGVYFLAQGEYNINFVIEGTGKKYVFRVNTGSQLMLENQIGYEYEALKRLETSSVTPRVYFVDSSKEFFEYGVLIMEFLEGRHLDYTRDLKKAADIFSRIHSIDIEKIDAKNFIVEKNIFSERIAEGKRLLKDFLDSDKADKNIKSFFTSFLEWAEENKHNERYFIENKWHVINNTEVNSGNFIIGDKGHYLIDWEKPVISDPCQDLTQFLAHTTTLWKADYVLSSDEREMFFNSYIEGLGGEDRNIKERVEMYTPYLYLRALSWCACAYLEYLRPDKDIKNMDTFEKIKSYLDLDFMKGLLGRYINIKW